MVIDKGLGIGATRDMLQLAAPYVDLIKFAFGTSLLYPEGVLRQKIELIRASGVDVYPGGTFLEIAVWQRRWPAFLDRAVDLGFTWVEVSEGTIDLDRATRTRLIEGARERGLRVIAEVGKKDRAFKLSAGTVHDGARSDLDAGAEYVIVEGRDSGRGVGIYDDDGVADANLVDAIVSGVADPDRLVWEAPQTKQQQDLLLRFGANVSLGNVHPEDLITLEATRQGLRGDTLRHALKRPRPNDSLKVPTEPAVQRG